MIRYVSSRFIEDLPLVQRATASVLSMASTAKSTRTKDGIRFDRGAMSVSMSHGGRTAWRDATAGRSAFVEFNGIRLDAGCDPRMAAINLSEELADTIAGAAESGIPLREVAGPSSQIRRIVDALRAAAGLAGLEHADISVTHPWGSKPASGCVYDDGPEPFRLHPDVETALVAGLEDTCSIETRRGNDRVTVDMCAAECNDTAESDAMGLLRLVAGSGLDPERLKLRRRW